MLKFLSNNIPPHSRFVDASVGRGKLFNYVRPAKWLINEPSKSKHNIWKCVYDNPEELIKYVKSDKFGNSCQYGNAGLQLYMRDFNEIHKSGGQYNEEYFDNITSLNKYMNSTSGKITNMDLTSLIDEIVVSDFVYIEDMDNIYPIVDNYYIDAISNCGGNIMIVKKKTDPDLYKKFVRHNMVFITKDIVLVTNY